MLLHLKRAYRQSGAAQPTLSADERHKNGNVLAAARQLKRKVDHRGRGGLGAVEHALGQRMAYPVGVGVLDVLADAIWAGMDRLAAERVVVQYETVVRFLKAGMVGENVAGHHPKLAA